MSWLPVRIIGIPTPEEQRISQAAEWAMVSVPWRMGTPPDSMSHLFPVTGVKILADRTRYSPGFQEFHLHIFPR